jgi:hypothetical protein
MSLYGPKRRILQRSGLVAVPPAALSIADEVIE